MEDDPTSPFTYHASLHPESIQDFGDEEYDAFNMARDDTTPVKKDSARRRVMRFATFGLKGHREHSSSTSSSGSDMLPSPVSPSEWDAMSMMGGDEGRRRASMDAPRSGPMFSPQTTSAYLRAMDDSTATKSSTSTSPSSYIKRQVAAVGMKKDLALYYAGKRWRSRSSSISSVRS
ncbi:hypothetical protein DL93DRAFT_2087334 [Clavulina sp. PMI_390]|nr:hypothetical protein DL93DRAFT_2087334 [Clavulina sp. PMI_390]